MDNEQHYEEPRRRGLLSFLVQAIGFVLATLVESVIHYKVHPLNEVNTAGQALVVAFSFWPGMLVGHFSMWIQRITGDENPDPSAAAAICALLWFFYLFRAFTLAIGLPWLSDWTEWPVMWLVQFFELCELDWLLKD